MVFELSKGIKGEDGDAKEETRETEKETGKTEKNQEVINQRRTNPARVVNPFLERVAKVVENFENPSIPELNEVNNNKVSYSVRPESRRDKTNVEAESHVSDKKIGRELDPGIVKLANDAVLECLECGGIEVLMYTLEEAVAKADAEGDNLLATSSGQV